MKHGATIFSLFILTIITTSCKKENASIIVGKWSIVKDSSFVAQAPPFFNAVPGNIYFGVVGDYYNFTTEGKLYIKEGAYADTLSYSLSPNNQVEFIYNSYNLEVDSTGNIISQNRRKKSYTIEALSANQLTMTSNLNGDILTPVGYFANMLTLKR